MKDLNGSSGLIEEEPLRTLLEEALREIFQPTNFYLKIQPNIRMLQSKA